MAGGNIAEGLSRSTVLDGPIASFAPTLSVNKPAPERVLWESKIELGRSDLAYVLTTEKRDRFRHPVPLDMNTLTALKRSTLGLDLYLWLVYRTFSLRAPLRLTWQQVYRQFGAHPTKANDHYTVKNFRYKVLRELKKIKIAWPSLNYATGRGVLILSPSVPAIPPSDHHQLAS